MNQDLVVDLQDVFKTYGGKVHALRGVKMQIRRGEIYGLLGPNGAGKSTLVKILMTVIRATKATGTLLGNPLGHKPTLARVGYLPEHHKFADYLTGLQLLDHFGALSGVPRAVRRSRAGELLELVGMLEWSGTKIKGYSKGMRQRIGIAQAMINDPDLVVLDEPTDGVDPVGRRDIRNMLGELKRRGKTVLLNSHLLSELEMVCDRVAILVQGNVNREGTLDELTNDQRFFSIEIQESPDASSRLAQAIPAHCDIARIEASSKRPSSRWLSIDNHTLQLGNCTSEEAMPFLDALRNMGCTIVRCGPHRPTLEDLFMQAVTDSSGKTLLPGASRHDNSKTIGGAA